ncbi:cobalamin biosynthesis protein CbiG [bacterium]|nr:cobalamin biosynthesis protein CbiG [bacterium]
MARLFDSIIVVDWSAASKPTTGADSIWIGAQQPDSRLKLAFKSANPPTRAKAVEELEDLLTRCLKRGDRVLLGVDFSLGYPAGTAAALGLSGEPWRAMRAFLSKEMKDKPDNTNNRFALAARMNRLISSGPFPFWGCSKKDELTTLSVKKAREHGPGDLAEYRITETVALAAKKGRPQPVWKIAYAGAVGGQTMTGIPAIEKLRDKIPGMKLWPFEIPLGPLRSDALDEVRVVVSEVYPSMNETRAEANEIRDEAQVRTLSQWFGDRDSAGKLGGLFAPSAPLTDEQKAAVEREEGWILGI